VWLGVAFTSEVFNGFLIFKKLVIILETFIEKISIARTIFRNFFKKKSTREEQEKYWRELLRSYQPIVCKIIVAKYTPQRKSAHI
jgi:hypothetical protein